jgi:hypothetical protein
VFLQGLLRQLLRNLEHPNHRRLNSMVLPNPLAAQSLMWLSRYVHFYFNINSLISAHFRPVSCSAIDQWKRYDGNFDHEAFYNNIVNLFERKPNHRWVREALAWWNKYVMLLASSRSNSYFYQGMPRAYQR